MLWNYAPSTVLVGAESFGRPFGASRRDLPMGRCRWGGALLRPAAAGGGANRHQRAEYIARRSAQFGKRLSAAGKETVQRVAQLQRIRDNLAANGSNFFRYGRRCSPFESQSGAASRPQHYLAYERRTAGRPAEFDVLYDRPAGSRHLLGDGDHHGPANRRILEQQQRDILRTPDRRELTSVAAAQIAPAEAPVPAAPSTEARLVR
jgi:hypothetical protein